MLGLSNLLGDECENYFDSNFGCIDDLTPPIFDDPMDNLQDEDSISILLLFIKMVESFTITSPLVGSYVAPWL
tara:strand:+ start:627 stop:845 length:219 start_codon:yes stop_codon:yes gene_type:complete